MNAERVVAEMKKLYPGSNIKKLPPENPTEIVCEPPFDNVDHSIAVAVIDKSVPHKHLKTREIYRVTKGTVRLFVGDKEIELQEGDQYIIEPGTVHSAEGNESWIEVDCTPAWTPKDHILVENS